MTREVEIHFTGRGIRVILKDGKREEVVYSGHSVTLAHEAYNRCLDGMNRDGR